MMPFDPKPMPGADARAIALETVAIAIAQIKVLTVYAAAQQADIEAQRLAQRPVMPGFQQKNEELGRQHQDLQTMQGSLNNYLGGLSGWQTGEKQQHNASWFLPVPEDINAYIRSVVEDKPYVAPVHTN